MSERPRYMIMSADSHAGADILGYRPYLASELHDEFDAWAPTFSDAWTRYDDELTYTDNPAIRLGITSFMSPYNWDHDKRIEHMDDQGIAAEVVLPNTVPPFYESGTTTSGQPVTDEDYRRRWAGVQAHNRWVVDFCALAPERRAGIAQVYLGDVDAAIEEVRWAKEQGLRGVLIPSDSHTRLVNLYERRLDPFWAVCEDLELPVHRHSIAVNPPEDDNVGPGGVAVGAHETMLFFHRGLAHLIIGGVFERFPRLRFVFVETGAGWIRPELERIQYQMSLGVQRGHMLYPFWRRAVEELRLSPAEYFARNCFLGASLCIRADIEARYDVGVDNLLWGADYPHHEGTWPYTELVLRALFAGVPEAEVRKMLGLTAAQLYGMDVAALQSIADRIGPTVEAVDRPVAMDEIPPGSYCIALTDLEAPMPRM